MTTVITTGTSPFKEKNENFASARIFLSSMRLTGKILWAGYFDIDGLLYQIDVDFKERTNFDRMLSMSKLRCFETCVIKCG